MKAIRNLPLPLLLFYTIEFSAATQRTIIKDYRKVSLNQELIYFFFGVSSLGGFSMLRLFENFSFFKHLHLLSFLNMWFLEDLFGHEQMHRLCSRV